MSAKSAEHKLPTHAAPRLSAMTTFSLRDDRVTIGPVMPDDSAALFIWMNDVDAAGLDYTYHPVDWLSFKNWNEQIGGSKVQVFFAIRRIESPSIIGFVFFKNIDPIHRSAELGIRIGQERERGQGLGTSALRLALGYAWNHLNLHRVHLNVFAHNHRAIASYKSAGFAEEGLLRQAAFIDGKWVDVVPMAILRAGTRSTR